MITVCTVITVFMVITACTVCMMIKHDHDVHGDHA